MDRLVATLGQVVGFDHVRWKNSHLGNAIELAHANERPLPWIRSMVAGRDEAEQVDLVGPTPYESSRCLQVVFGRQVLRSPGSLANEAGLLASFHNL
jgi:hypothetical protein